MDSYHIGSLSVAEEFVDVRLEIPLVDVDADVWIKFLQIVHREDAYFEGMLD